MAGAVSELLSVSYNVGRCIASLDALARGFVLTDFEQYTVDQRFGHSPVAGGFIDEREEMLVHLALLLRQMGEGGLLAGRRGKD